MIKNTGRKKSAAGVKDRDWEWWNWLKHVMKL